MEVLQGVVVAVLGQQPGSQAAHHGGSVLGGEGDEAGGGGGQGGGGEQGCEAGGLAQDGAPGVGLDLAGPHGGPDDAEGGVGVGVVAVGGGVAGGDVDDDPGQRGGAGLAQGGGVLADPGVGGGPGDLTAPHRFERDRDPPGRGAGGETVEQLHQPTEVVPAGAGQGLVEAGQGVAGSLEPGAALLEFGCPR